MKRILILLVSILTLSTIAFATESYDTMLINEDFGYDPAIANGIINDDSILVQLNGEVIDFTDEKGNKVDPQIINERTMVPMRKIFEVLGADVEWFSGDRRIEATTEELEIGLQIDNQIATITNKSGEVTEITLDSAPVIMDGRTLVPARFVANSLGQKVGWDAYNRVVVIIDPSIIENTIKNDAPNFYEYLTSDFEKIDTYEMEIDIDGKLKYVDEENRKNNTSLTLAGEMGIKKSETALAMDLELDFTGRGILLETVKEQGYEDIEINVVMDIENNALYLKSSLEENDKWIKYNLGEEGIILKQALEMAQKQNSSNIKALEDVLINEKELTIVSYEELKMKIKMLTEVMGNKNFKVSGRNTKTYTLTLDLTKLLEIEGLKLELELETKIANKIAKESNCTVTLGLAEAEENIEITLEVNSVLDSYNDKVIIKMPKEKDIIEMYE